MNNPLLELTNPLPFDAIRPEHVVPAVESVLRDARLALEEIAGVVAPTFDNTFGALERATEAVGLVMGVVEHLESVATTPELREAHNTVLPDVSSFWSSIPLHAGLYRSLSAFAKTAEFSTLGPTKKRLVEKTLADFRRHGAELAPEGKKRLEEIDRELSLLTTQFSQNVLDATNAFELVVDETRVRGLPPSALAMARESAEAKGIEGFRLTLQAPSVTAVLTFADDARLREEVWRAFNRRGVGERNNLPLLAGIVRLRREKARLLGFDNFADLVTSDRMAKDGATAQKFVADLTSKTEAAFEREKRELLAFRRRLEGPEAPELSPWDVAYYSEKQRKELFDFDEEALRPYFSAARVLEGAFELARRLYGVRIEDQPLSTWHESVRGHRIVGESGEPLAVFYTDLYPRENKRDGAWMHGMIAAVPPDVHVALFCANSQPPTKDAPSLLSFRDVETVFHEFGHLLHHCLSRVEVRSLSCTRVAQDFVELPSQILENWCSEKEALDTFAIHYRTGETIPAELVQKLLSSRHYRAATMQMRQLGFAAVDLALHMDYEPDDDANGERLLAFANGVLGRYSASPLPSDYAMIASFGHLFSHPVGYAAGYYSYKWAEVLDADAFSRFKREGLFDRRVGEAFRASILSRGDSADPLDLFVEFMGRAPRLEPMLERLGLLPEAAE